MQNMKDLLARLRAQAAARNANDTVAQIDTVTKVMEREQPHEVDTSNLGTTSEEIEETVGAIVDRESSPFAKTALTLEGGSPRQLGVSKDVTLNSKQQQFLDTVLSGVDANLIGAAGTGKTTTMRQVTRALIDGGYLPRLGRGTKWLATGTPGMVILSFTNKAVNNIRHAVVDELKANTITVHKLLQFEPVFYEIPDPANPGYYKKTMRFEPSYTRSNPLPDTIRVVAFEESSMIGLDLYQQFCDAMQHPHQEIFLGDIQQLPPVFGPAILGFKLNELVTVELTEIYRQAANSPIIDLAWAMLSGDASKFS
jgi:ATP-dependent exoDNAse (exonuclease V) alpha subunit